MTLAFSVCCRLKTLPVLSLLRPRWGPWVLPAGHVCCVKSKNKGVLAQGRSGLIMIFAASASFFSRGRPPRKNGLLIHVGCAMYVRRRKLPPFSVRAFVSKPTRVGVEGVAVSGTASPEQAATGTCRPWYLLAEIL